ncbi:hypothetical protein ACH5RR_040913, partial [Cinchona calisaya]
EIDYDEVLGSLMDSGGKWAKNDQSLHSNSKVKITPRRNINLNALVHIVQHHQHSMSRICGGYLERDVWTESSDRSTMMA